MVMVKAPEMLLMCCCLNYDYDYVLHVVDVDSGVILHRDIVGVPVGKLVVNENFAKISHRRCMHLHCVFFVDS